MDRTRSDSMYALQDVPGKDSFLQSTQSLTLIPHTIGHSKGLVATKDIHRGTRIHSEEPIITVPSSITEAKQQRIHIYQQASSLSEDQKRAFLSMHNIYPYKNAVERYLGIYQTNGLPIERDDEDGSGIFLEAYIRVHNNRKARQDKLRAKFGIPCSCGLCSLPADQSRESDQRLDRITELDGIIDQGGAMGFLSSPLRILGYVEQQIRLYNEHTPGDVGLTRAYLEAAQIFIANGDLARGRIFTERAVSGWRTSYGGSTEVIQFNKLVEDPSAHSRYGYSMKWKTSVDEVPRDLEPDDFGNWLWKRKKATTPGQLADLRSRATFPGFGDLPHERATLIRTTLKTEIWPRADHDDANDKTVPLFFYTDGRSSESAPSQIIKGYTVAILEPGIRHEDPEMMKIFPVSLDKLQKLSDQVQKFSTELDGLRTCHGCGKKEAFLKRFAKSSCFWYCGRACQEAGWKEKGHETECKILKDSDFRGIFHLKWNTFDGHVQFPLGVGASS
ncbi:hypothetical protein K458DRAFT_443613 [Lentithecium fluviatile CBS 122367]|uniref:MYND-type domain-containing protein n=1 Tax=Lentithecium fluviatile CBS 122367 TaxID=1168545 RepID=A0A6G1IXB3_9PLEO|nr:hypothetical protein K458DRAFT_443613 [Lentithecium fluviatile CBS 122367]